MVTKMLEKAIEIEGLLRIIRDGKPLPETYALLKRKAAELAEETQGIEESNQAKDLETSHGDIVITVAATAKEQPEVVFSDAPTYSPIDDLDLSEEDDIILTFDEGADPDSRQEEDDDEEEEEETTEEKIPEKSSEDEPQKEEQPASSAEPAVENKPEKNRATRRENKLKSAFSLNDRFLYSRELFGGDMKMFDSALDFIEGVDDYSVIEEYFYNEMEWNPENMAVASFMEILRPHFRQ